MRKPGDAAGLRESAFIENLVPNGGECLAADFPALGTGRHEFAERIRMRHEWVQLRDSGGGLQFHHKPGGDGKRFLVIPHDRRPRQRIEQG